jgi:dUTP pyrophosphatase
MEAQIYFHEGVNRQFQIDSLQGRLRWRGIESTRAVPIPSDSPEVIMIDGVAYDLRTIEAQSHGWRPLEEVQFSALTITARLPERGSFDAAGLDLFADNAEPIILRPFDTVVIPTGIAVQCPTGTYARVAPRSGRAIKGLFVNAGVVDRDYRGEIGVVLALIRAPDGEGETIRRGDKVAQLILERYVDAQPSWVNQLSRTARENGGFGSTGS